MIVSPELISLEQSIKSTLRDVPDFPKPGILFKDITPIFYDQKLCSRIVDEFIERLAEKPDAMIGIESRGFLFGFMVANKLNIPFVLVRKAGKLPYKTVSVEYDLEYGTSKMEMHEDALQKDWNVLIHDDLLATGGTAEAAAQLVKKMGAKVLGFNFVIGLDFLNGKNKLAKHSNNITCLVHF
jgi:adenine phosphoribosyltransferase